MSLDRRRLLKGLAAAGAVAATGGGAPAAARERRLPAADAVGVLYDATRCSGCKTCQVACRQANDLPPESPDELWDAPADLSARTKTLVKRYREAGASSFVKVQCMHCVDPACVSVCMLGALHKAEHGVVAYDPGRCIGCRYCQVACAFDVPRFEWDSPTPRIVKCELCRDRLAAGGIPACCEVCPTGALTFGRRDELLAEAHRRIAEQPGRYQPRVYGEDDAGGTGVLYLASVPFAKLGLPDLGSEPVPELSESLQHGIYQGFVAPIALYALLTFVTRRNRRAGEEEEAEEPGRHRRKRGPRAQEGAP